MGDGRHPVPVVAAKTAAAVEGHVVEPGLHVEGQRTDGGDGGPVGFGRRADFEHSETLGRRGCWSPDSKGVRLGPLGPKAVNTQRRHSGAALLSKRAASGASGPGGLPTSTCGVQAAL